MLSEIDYYRFPFPAIIDDVLHTFNQADRPSKACRIIALSTVTGMSIMAMTAIEWQTLPHAGKSASIETSTSF